MNIKCTIMLILLLAVLPAVSTERKFSEAMELLGVDYAPIEYELKNLGGDIEVFDGDIPDRLEVSKSKATQPTPLDDFLDLLTSIKAHIFDNQASQLNSKKFIDTALAPTIDTHD